MVRCRRFVEVNALFYLTVRSILGGEAALCALGMSLAVALVALSIAWLVFRLVGRLATYAKLEPAAWMLSSRSSVSLLVLWLPWAGIVTAIALWIWLAIRAHLQYGATPRPLTEGISDDPGEAESSVGIDTTGPQSPSAVGGGITSGDQSRSP